LKSKYFESLKKHGYLLVLTMLLIFILSGCVLMPTEREPLPPPLVEPPRLRFNLHTVEIGDIIHQIIGAGIFVPISEFNLSFLNNSGRLQAVHVVPGMHVEEGQVLAELESEQIEFDISQMEIDLSEMRLSYDKMKMDYARMINSRRELRRALEIEASEQNKKALEDINHQIARLDIDMEIHGLNVKQHEMHIQRARERFDATKLRAPIAGQIVFMSRLAIGDWINAYQHLFTVADPSVIFLRYSPAVITGFEVGMTVKVDIDEIEYTGTIVMTPHGEPLIDVQNPRFEDSIIIKVEELPDQVRPGDDASIRVIFEEKHDVITIPRAGLRTMGARNYVVVRKDDINREVDVEVGVETPTMVEIVTGLDEGEQIVLR